MYLQPFLRGSQLPDSPVIADFFFFIIIILVNTMGRFDHEAEFSCNSFLFKLFFLSYNFYSFFAFFNLYKVTDYSKCL